MTSIDIYTILSSKPHNPHYLKRYIKFIEYCIKLNECIHEKPIKHHISPKAKDMFPEYASFRENSWNCAKLTNRQHFIAHWMLWKIYRNRSMTGAFNLMNNCNKTGLKLSSKVHEILMFNINKLGRSIETRIKMSKPKSSATRLKMSNSAKLKIFTDEHKANMSAAKSNCSAETRAKLSHAAKNCSVETRAKRSLAAKGKKCKPFSLEHRTNLSKAAEGKRSIIICPHCAKSGGNNNMKRWHFDNCKSLKFT